MASIRRAAVLGSPIAHSLSPVLHRAAYEALGLEHWRYERHEVDEAGFASFLRSCDSTWAGLSLTMPLKVTAIQHMDVIEPLAQVVGAINTVLLTPGPLLVGANTDVHGIVAALAGATPQGRATASKAVIIGGGATASSALIALGQIGVKAATVVVRSRSRAGGVMRAGTNAGLEPNFVTFEEDRLPAVLAEADVIISTIPRAGSAHLLELLEAVHPQPGQILLDVIYGGGASPLLEFWHTRGGSTATGLDMLLHQAAEQVRLMTSAPPPIAAMRAALDASLAQG